MHNKSGANVKILVTQPRRIAASALAMRVATERAEKLGNSIGYSVRLEKWVLNNLQVNPPKYKYCIYFNSIYISLCNQTYCSIGR